MKLNELKMISENIDLDNYILFRNQVKKMMEYPEWLGDFSREDLEKMLNTGSKIWIFYLEKESVCSMMIIPANEKSIDKFGLNIDYKQTIDYGPMMVSPKFIGNSLQYQMLEFLDAYCKKKEYNYAISTIHPENIYSINNFLKDDFNLKGSKTFKRGVRNIYLKELR